MERNGNGSMHMIDKIAYIYIRDRKMLSTRSRG